MTYDLAEDGTLSRAADEATSTPAWALERMAAILQDVPSVFETDTLRPLVDLAEELSGRAYADGGATTRAMRILADHSRGTAVLIADGVVPSNEDRGYVLRRIMRRAIQQGRTLGLEAPFLRPLRRARARDCWATPTPSSPPSASTIAALGRRRGGELRPHARPRHRAARASWSTRRKAGEHLLGRRRRRLQAARHLRLPLRPDQGAAGRAGPVGRRPGLRGADGGAARARPHRAAPPRTAPRTTTARSSPSPPGPPPTRFVGYEKLRAETEPGARPRPTTAASWPSSRRAPSTPRAAARSPTPGVVRWDGGEARVADVYRVGDDQALALEPAARARGRHAGRGRGRPRDPPRDDAQPHRHAPAARGAARAARHPRPPGRLGGAPRQAALRLHPRRARSAPRSCATVEDRVNEWIKASRPVRAMQMSRAEAEKLGAMALFGEKYGEWVRVVEVEDVSRELCGGTHVANTAEVGIFTIASEGSSAANVRRIEALTGPGRDRLVPRARRASCARSAELLGAPQDPVARRAGAPRERLKELEQGRRRAPARPTLERGRRAARAARRATSAAMQPVVVGGGRDADQQAAARARRTGSSKLRRRRRGRARRRRRRQGRPRRQLRRRGAWSSAASRPPR